MVFQGGRKPVRSREWTSGKRSSRSGIPSLGSRRPSAITAITSARPCREFYRLNHRHQTLEFVLAKEREFLPKTRRTMSIWEAMEFLNTLVDDSDPDTDLTQIEHLMQTAEAIRADGHPRWFVLVGLIHDLGKILCLWGEPQWAVVGDTFPVGCPYSEKVVFADFFRENPDYRRPDYQIRVRDLRAGLRARPCPHVLGAR